MAIWKPAEDEARRERETALDEALAASFPASDPPARIGPEGRPPHAADDLP